MKNLYLNRIEDNFLSAFFNNALYVINYAYFFIKIYSFFYFYKIILTNIIAHFQINRHYQDQRHPLLVFYYQ